MKLRGWVGFKVWVNCPNYTNLLLLGVPLCKPHEHEVWISLHHHRTPKQTKEKSMSPGGQYPESLMCICAFAVIVKNWPPRNCGFLACWSSFHIQVSSSISLSLEGRKFTVVCVLCMGRLDIFHRRGVPYLGTWVRVWMKISKFSIYVLITAKMCGWWPLPSLSLSMISVYDL